ncbi:MAG: hypothetical protein GY832_15090 [Chloroflexi bacterium]|nr:hypothetical protein [Chloroflexota bacterium]
MATQPNLTSPKPAPSLATAETEGDPSGGIAFSLCKDLVMNHGPQIATSSITLSHHLHRRRDPSPLPRRLPLFYPGSALACFLGPGAEGDGAAVPFGGTSLGEMLWFAVVGAGVVALWGNHLHVR